MVEDQKEFKAEDAEMYEGDRVDVQPGQDIKLEDGYGEYGKNEILNLAGEFEKIDIGDFKPREIPHDAFIIYHNSGRGAQTRDQYISAEGEPKHNHFKVHDYTISGVLTGDENLKDYHFTPENFVRHIKLSKDEENKLDRIVDEEKGDKAKFALQCNKFRQIAGDIGIPADIPTGKKRQAALAKHKEVLPHAVFWSEDKIVATFRRSEGDKFAGMQLEEAIGVISEQTGATITRASLQAAKKENFSFCHADSIQREWGPRAVNQRWGAPAGESWANENFPKVSMWMGKGHNYNAEPLTRHAPDSLPAQLIAEGEAAGYLRIRSPKSGGQNSILYAMENNRDDTVKILKEANIPLANVEKANWATKAETILEKINELRPPFSVLDKDDRDTYGPPPKGVNVMDDYSPAEILVENRGNGGRGDRTGNASTLEHYQVNRLRLPDDAAKTLGLDPEIYSSERSESKSMEPQWDQPRRNDRERGRQAGGGRAG